MNPEDNPENPNQEMAEDNPQNDNPNPEGNPQGEQGENGDEDDELFEHLPADHPHLRRFQNSLEEQLKAEEEKLRLLFKEKTEDSKKLKREREDIGISLYSLQQQFANVESNFNEQYSKCKALEEQQKQESERLQEEVKMYNDKFQSVKEQEKMVLQSSEDLNQLNSMLKYVETYNLQVQSEIKVTKTTANKVEENIVNQERKKKEQDFFIDMLEMRVKNLTEKKLLYEAQLKSQQDETKEARVNLSEADLEIQHIIEKKRDLIKDLDKAMFNLRLKDNAKTTVNKNIEEQEEEKLKLMSQIGRFRILIRQENQRNNELEESLRQCKKKLQNVENSIKDLQSKHEKLEEKRHFIETSINKTKVELDNLAKIQQSLDIELELNKIHILFKGAQPTVYPSSIVIPPKTSLYIATKIRPNEEGTTTIIGVKYEMINTIGIQYIDDNGNGLFFNYENKYIDLAKNFLNAVTTKQQLISLSNIKIYPEIPKLNYKLIGNEFLEEKLNLFDNQLYTFQFKLTNVGIYDVDKLTCYVYVYKTNNYKVTLDEINKEVKIHKNGGEFIFNYEYWHKSMYEKIEFKIY
jgi:hypothetical protein